MSYCKLLKGKYYSGEVFQENFTTPEDLASMINDLLQDEELYCEGEIHDPSLIVDSKTLRIINKGCKNSQKYKQDNKNHFETIGGWHYGL